MRFSMRIMLSYKHTAMPSQLPIGVAIVHGATTRRHFCACGAGKEFETIIINDAER